MRLHTFLCVAVLAVSCSAKSLHPRRAVVVMDGGVDVKGKLVLEQAAVHSPVKIRGVIYGLQPGLHGMHIHEGPELGAHCELVGSHFNPAGKLHGGPHDPERHVGDLGNIKVLPGNPTRADVNILSTMMSLYEGHPYSILNRPLAIHAGTDDLGRGQSPKSRTGGDSGSIVTCALIEAVDEFDPSQADHSVPELPPVKSEVVESEPVIGNVEDKRYGNVEVDATEKGDGDFDLHLKEAVATSKIWKVGRIYEFDYMGWISTAMSSISPRYSGGSIKARVIVEPADDRRINMRLVDIRTKMFNEDVLQEMIRVDPGTEVPVLDLEHLEKPIQLKMVKGKVESVSIAKDEPLWTVNFKRALAAHIQLQLDSKSNIFRDRSHSAYYAENSVYHTTEGCTSGECQTWYQISRVPVEQIRADPEELPVPELCAGSTTYEIVKSRNFDKCRVLPVFNYISNRARDCTVVKGAGCQNDMSHADSVRIIGCYSADADQFIVQRIKSMDRLIVKPLGYETEALDGQAIQHLHLKTIRSVESADELKPPVDKDVNVYKTLAYAYDEEQKTRGPLMDKPTLHQISDPMIIENDAQALRDEAERLLREILDDLDSESFYSDPATRPVADKIDMLRRVFSLLEFADLLAVVSPHTTTAEWSTAKQIVVDSLVLSGTNPSITIVRDLILKGQLTGEHAAQAVSALPATIKTPTRELLTTLVTLLKSDPVSQDHQVKITLALSLTRLIFQACINKDSALDLFPKLVMGQFCSPRDSFIVEDLLPWLTGQLNNATESSERIALLAALGNLGHEMIVPSLIPYISSCEPSTVSEYEWSQKSFEEPKSKKTSRRKWLEHKRKSKEARSSIHEKIEKLKVDKKAKKEAESEEHSESEKHFSKGQRIKAKYAKKPHKAEEAEDEVKPHHKRHRRSLEHHEDSKELRKETSHQMKEAKHQRLGVKPEDTTEEEILDVEESQVPEEVNIEDAVKQFEEEQDRLGKESGKHVDQAEDEATCHIIRTKAILAMSHLAAQRRKVVSSVLMPIYFNREEDTQIRLSALTMLFVSSPPQAFWERVALSTWFEPDDQITHFIYTTITSLVSNKNSKRREAHIHAESVLPMVKPMRWISYVSSNYLKAGYEEKSRLGYSTKTSFFPGFESFVPSNHYSSLHLHFGPWFTKFVEYSVSSKQAEKFIDYLTGKGSRNFGPELQKIKEELKIEARATGQPELFIYWNIVDNYQRFFSINSSTVEDFVENILRRNLFSPDGAQFSMNFHKYLPIADTFIRIPSSMGLAYSLFAHVRAFGSLKSTVSGAFDFGTLSAKLEGETKPVATFAAMHKMNVEAPFSRSYPAAGVHMEMSLALPGIFTLETDLRSGKVQTRWKFTGDKIRIARHSVIPFTSVRKANDFRPTLLLEDTLPIVLLSEPKHQEYAIGEKAVGLNLIHSVRGDVEAIRTPSAFSNDWFGSLVFYQLPSTLKYRESNLHLDNIHSETKTIRTVWSFTAKRKGSIRWESAADEDRTSAKFQRLFRHLKDPLGYTLDFNVEFASDSDKITTRRYGTSIAYGIGDQGLSHRANVLMEKQIEETESSAAREDNFVLCMELEANLPRPAIVRREDFNRDDLSRTSSVKIGFGKSCTDDRKIVITTKLTRGEELLPSTVRTKWEDKHCAKQEAIGRGISEECVSTRRLASILNKGTVTIDYNEMPALVRNVTAKATNLFRYWMGPYMYDNQVDVNNTENQIRIESVYYPIIGSMDIRVFKPHSNTFFHGIDIHPVAEVILPFNPRVNAFRAAFGAPGLCMVDRQTVTTFDGLNYKVSMSGCDKVLTKDCSGRYQMAVLVRNERNRKVATVLLDEQKIEIRPAELKVIINEEVEDLRDNEIRHVRNAEDELVAQIRPTRDGFIILESASHKIRVTASADEVIVLGSPVHRGRLCGLCGSQTNNKADDLTGPSRCSLPVDLMDAAFELNRPEGCYSSKSAKQIQLLDEAENQCKKKKSASVFGLTDARPLVPESQQKILSLSIRSVDPDANCTVARSKMIHRGHKRCFSTTSVTKCLEGCRPKATEEVKLGFHCVAGGPLSDQLKEDVLIRPLDELIGKEISTVQSFRVPTACVPVK